MGGAVALCLALFLCVTEPHWAAVYQDPSIFHAAAKYLRRELQQRQSLSRSLLGDEDAAAEVRPLWASRLQLLELVAAFRSGLEQPGAKLQRVYRGMLVSRQLMLGPLTDPLAAHAALEEAGAELGFQFGDGGIFMEAEKQLGSSWHQPSPHQPACVEEMALLLAMREGRARPDIAETGSSPEKWLAHMLPSFDSSRELESMEHLGGHVEVATLRTQKLLNKPILLVRAAACLPACLRACTVHSIQPALEC